jgi:hypothetical protein
MCRNPVARPVARVSSHVSSEPVGCFPPIFSRLCDIVMGWIWPDIGLIYETTDGRQIKYSESHAVYDGALAGKMIRRDTTQPTTIPTVGSIAAGTIEPITSITSIEPIEVPVRAPSPQFTPFVNGISTIAKDTVKRRRRPISICIVVSTRGTNDQPGNYISLPIITVSPDMTLHDIRIAATTAIEVARQTPQRHLQISDIVRTWFRADYIFDSWSSLYKIRRDDGLELRLVATESVVDPSRADVLDTLDPYDSICSPAIHRMFVICAVDGPDFRIIACTSQQN